MRRRLVKSYPSGGPKNDCRVRSTAGDADRWGPGRRSSPRARPRDGAKQHWRSVAEERDGTAVGHGCPPDWQLNGIEFEQIIPRRNKRSRSQGLPSRITGGKRRSIPSIISRTDTVEIAGTISTNRERAYIGCMSVSYYVKSRFWEKQHVS